MSELLLAVTLAVIPVQAPPEMAAAMEQYNQQAETPRLPYAFEGHQFDEERMTDLIAVYFPAQWRTWALRVSECESGWYTTAKNPRSTAAGLFQFKRSTWNWVAGETGTPRYDSGGVWEVHHQMINAAWLVQNGGPQHWVCR